MDKDLPASPEPGGNEPPPDRPSFQQQSGIPVGDMYQEGETHVGPLPSLIKLENWEESDVASAAHTDDAGLGDTT